MAIRNRHMATLVALLMLFAVACSDSGELEEAQAEVATLESALSGLEASNTALEGNLVDLEASQAALEDEKSLLETANAELEATLASQGQSLILQADIVGEGCMLQNAYLNDGEQKATFRVRVYDPITGEQLDEQALAGVTVTLGDGQEFDLSWGAHPPDTENDFFWTYGWEIFEEYPAGNIPFTITATAVDGRTGEFEPFNVAPSLLTVIDINAEPS